MTEKQKFITAVENLDEPALVKLREAISFAHERACSYGCYRAESEDSVHSFLLDIYDARPVPNPLDGFFFNLTELTVGPNQEIGEFIFFDCGDKTGKYEVVSKTENRDGNFDLKLQFCGYERK